MLAFEDAQTLSALTDALVSKMNPAAPWRAEADGAYEIDVPALFNAVKSAANALATDFQMLKRLEGLKIWNALNVNASLRRVSAIRALQALSGAPLPAALEGAKLTYAADAARVALSLRTGDIAASPSLSKSGDSYALKADAQNPSSGEPLFSFDWTHEGDAAAWTDAISFSYGVWQYSIAGGGRGENGEAACEYDALMISSDHVLDLRASWTESFQPAPAPARADGKAWLEAKRPASTPTPTPTPRPTALPHTAVVFTNDAMAWGVRNALGKSGNATVYYDELEKITELNIRGTYGTNGGIKDITLLGYMPNLQVLYAFCNNISDISALAGLENLTKLYLHYNSISDVSGLRGLENLTELYLHYNSISDVSGLGGLENLTSLNLSDNSISDINALKALKNLKKLYLQNNNITDFTPLDGLTKLETLIK